MSKEIHLVFHNRGLRSYIEVDLCYECPRQDQKGCCAYYSPVFYASDFVYWLNNQPDLIDYLFSLPHLTILDASVTLNNIIDGRSYRCRFHTKENGCLLTQQNRESICRHFVCPGISWEKESSLAHWKVFFESLSDYEIKLNNQLADILKERNLSLRNRAQRSEIFALLPAAFARLTKNPPGFFSSCPEREEAVIIRPVSYGEEWPL
ncbi:MAG: hypothetical protein ABRQ26_12785 [Syntrophomonadaceae bacterium]